MGTSSRLQRRSNVLLPDPLGPTRAVIPPVGISRVTPLNRAPEEEFLPYCKENNIGVMIRGPLAKGLLSGRYDKSTVFEDKIRNAWHDDGAAQEKFESEIDRVDKLKELASPGPEMVQMALRYVISHPAVSVVIPGAKDPSQAITNAAAGSEILDAGTLEKLRNLT